MKQIKETEDPKPFQSVRSLSEMKKSPPEELLPITLWVPVLIKKKFDRGQEETRKLLGKELKKQVCQYIDLAVPAED